MHVIDQIWFYVQTYPWFPSLIFVGILGGLYLLLRPTAAPELAPPVAAEGLKTKPVAATKPKEQRVGSRRQGNPVEVYVAPPEDKEHPGIGSVLDRSVGGIRMAIFHEVAIGTVLAVHPVRADSMVPWVEVEVRSCKESVEMPGQWEVGCQYVKSPPYSIQLLFG